MGGGVPSREISYEQRLREEAERRHAELMRSVRAQAQMLRRVGQAAQANNIMTRMADPNIRNQIQRELHRNVAQIMNENAENLQNTMTEQMDTFINDGLEAD